jgi:transcriptional regulator with XRE-family HTH domain
MDGQLNFSGTKLKEKRVARSKTQTDVAEFLEITAQSYGEMERGLSKPGANNLAKLCIYFDCPIQDFFAIPENFFVKT